MSRTSLIIYLAILSLVSAGTALWITRLLNSARKTLPLMIGGAELPACLGSALAFGPVFHVLTFFYLAATALAFLRPSWRTPLAHTMAVLLIIQLTLVVFCLGGLAHFFVSMDNSMSPFAE